MTPLLRRRTLLLSLGLAAIFALSSGCSPAGGEPDGGVDLGRDTGPEEDMGQPPTCPAERQVMELCAGVPDEPLCTGADCESRAGCAEVVDVADDAALAKATMSAGEGTCLRLAAGAYGQVELPAGASLLGASAGETTVEGISVAAGEGSFVLGVGVGAGGIAIAEDAAGVIIEGVRVERATTRGIDVGPGATVTIRDTAVEGTGQGQDCSDGCFGIVAVDAAQLTMERTLVTGTNGPGVWIDCNAECISAGSGQVDSNGLLARDNALIGINLVGVDARLTATKVEATSPLAFDGGGGLGMVASAQVEAMGLEVTGNGGAGVLVDAATAVLGGMGPCEQVEISGNAFGMWVQNQGANQPVEVRNARLLDNDGVGFGLDGAAQGVLIEGGSEIRGTRMALVDVLIDGEPVGSEMVGDGITWQGGAQGVVRDVTLSGNERQSILIDGPVGDGSEISAVTLEGGDEGKGIVAQRIPDGGNVPTVSGGAKLELSTEIVPVAQAPLPPPPLR